MKHYLYSNDPELELAEEIESLGPTEIASFGRRHFQDEIYDVIHSVPLTMMAQGYFPDPWAVKEELFGQAKASLRGKLNGKVFAKSVDDDGAVVSDGPIDVFDIIIESITESEQGTIDSGAVILTMLTNFLNEGAWQYALLRQDGTVLRDPSEWPKPLVGESGAVWKDSLGSLEPALWFGLKGDDPIECWTLDRSPEKFALLQTLDSPFSSTPRLVQRWCNFWFCRFWALDWNALFDGGGNEHIIWMFAECGMTEPESEFEAVKEACPIALSESDTGEELIRKLDAFFLEKQRG